jgi:hypothetical protein
MLLYEILRTNKFLLAYKFYIFVIILCCKNRFYKSGKHPKFYIFLITLFYKYRVFKLTYYPKFCIFSIHLKCKYNFLLSSGN